VFAHGQRRPRQHPLPLFRQALDAGSLKRIENIARDMPHVSLGDALRNVELIAREDDARYERAAVKWLGRLATEGRGADLETDDSCRRCAQRSPGPA
jgi:hypothetical protein